MADNIYLDINQSAKVNIKDVYLRDVATITCQDKNVLNRLKTTKIFTFHPDDNKRYILSALKIIEIITEIYPSYTINVIGQDKLILEYEDGKPINKLWEFIKISFICITLFFGAGFAIMTFNSEAGVNDLFAYIYRLFTNKTSDGFTPLEIGYAIGIFSGITLFYNHLGKKKITKDPTPVEIEIRKYETDVNTTLIDGVKRKDSQIDVD